MTLVLGPPGCGKTTLMKLLAQQLDRGMRYDGELTFDGLPPDKRVHHRKTALVTQEDIHLAALTVKQTEHFASRLQPSSDDERRNHDQHSHNSTEEKIRRAEILLKVLGLSHRKDTLVGNEFIRGLVVERRRE